MNEAPHHLRKSDAEFIAQHRAQQRSRFLAELAKPHTTMAEAQSEASVTPFLVRSWRERDPEFDWTVRLTLLTNGTGRWLCGGGDVLTALLIEEADKPADERRSWPEVRVAIIERGGSLGGHERAASRPGRPCNPMTDEQFDSFMGFITNDGLSLTEAAKRAKITMGALNTLRQDPETDWDVRMAVLTHGSRRMLPGGSPLLRAMIAEEAAKPPHQRRQWAEIAAEMREWGVGGKYERPRPATADSPADLMPRPEAPPPAEPGSDDENF